jgi:coenzyme Q-binding protein COQ10
MLPVESCRKNCQAGRMSAITVTKRVEHSWLDLFQLVLDVESYPSFVPYCCEVRLLSRRSETPTRTVIVSRMTVGLSALRVSYANRTTGDLINRRIAISSIDGPLRSLDAAWRFDPETEQCCKVTFSVDYQFSSRMLEALVSRMFSGMFSQILDAFEHRADELFSSSRVPGH